MGEWANDHVMERYEEAADPCSKDEVLNVSDLMMTDAVVGDAELTQLAGGNAAVRVSSLEAQNAGLRAELPGLATRTD